MVVATSDGTKTLVTNGSAGGVIYANGADADGSILKGGAGDDSLRGGKYADDLFGGSGNDSYFGGGGVDNFHINMQDIKDGVDTDTLLDLELADGSDGDILWLEGFAQGTFSEHDTNHGSALKVGTWDGLVEALNSAVGINVTASQIGTTDNLLLVIDDNAGHVQNLVIKGGFADYLAAGGIVA
jgi:Ca2+-binding RTX toxin-like protein